MATVLASVTTATPVQLVTVGFSKETTATLARLQAAMKEHPVETLDLTLNTPEGQPFPYREWFGISREAYAQVRAAKPDLFPSGTSTLTVHKRGTGGSLLVLQGVTVWKPSTACKSTSRPTPSVHPGEPRKSASRSA